MDNKTRYALRVESREVLYADGDVNTFEGAEFWVCVEPEGWVEATSSPYHGQMAPDLLTFKTPEAAGRFAKRWDGHPWWCKPNGKFTVVPVRRKFVQCAAGYEEATPDS